MTMLHTKCVSIGASTPPVARRSKAQTVPRTIAAKPSGASPPAADRTSIHGMTRADLVKLIPASLERARTALPGDNTHAVAGMILRDLRAAGVRMVAAPVDRPQTPPPR